MKKLISAILVLVLVLSLTACGEEQGIAITNGMPWDLEEIYIVTAGAPDWGTEPVMDGLQVGVGGWLFPETTFGSREISVDILAIDEDGDSYEVYGVSLKDGDSCSLEIGENTEFIFRVGDTAHTGYRYFAEDDADAGSAYWGFYKMPDGFLKIYDDDTFEVMDLDGEVYAYGDCEYDEGVTLVSQDGEREFLVLDEDGNLYGGEDVGTLFRIPGDEQPDDRPNGITWESFQGYWMYDSGYLILIEDEMWYYYANDGELLNWGPVEYGDDNARLMNDGDEADFGTVYFDDEGDLIDEDQVLTYFHYFPYGGGENQANEMIAGEWYYSGQEYILTFDGVDGYSLEGAEQYESGQYSFNGSAVFFYDGYGNEIESGWIDEDGCLWLDSDDSGNWFYFGE